MFDKLKQLKQLKDLQDKMKKEVVTLTNANIKVSMNGSFDVLELVLDPELSAKDQEKTVLKLLNEAKSKIQSNLASSLAGSIF